jgi:hypothetical protein
MKISDAQLLAYNLQGFIPGPNEDEDAFQKRVDYCLQLEATHVNPLREACQVTPVDKQHYWQQAFPITKRLFDIAPDWVPLFFSNQKLPPWHGGCAWIFQEREDSPVAAILQMRQRFRHLPKYLGIYHRDELIAHELAHVGRMTFEEPFFEELLAYRTSHSSFRRWFGPIVQTMTESVIFLLAILLIFMIDGVLLFSGALETYLDLMWLKIVPAALIGYALWRLWRKHRTYNRCLNNVAGLIGKERAEQVIYRLTDKEISEFANATPTIIKKYAEEQKHHTLRWRLIVSAYL